MMCPAVRPHQGLPSKQAHCAGPAKNHVPGTSPHVKQSGVETIRPRPALALS